jgi:hypothetical protein
MTQIFYSLRKDPTSLKGKNYETIRKLVLDKHYNNKYGKDQKNSISWKRI